MLQQLYRAPLLLRWTLWRLRLGIWRRVRGDTWFPVATILCGGAVPLHRVLYSAAHWLSPNGSIPANAQGQRPLHRSSIDQGIAALLICHLRPDRCDHIWCPRWWAWLDAALGAQRHGLGLCISRLGFHDTLPCLDPVHDRSPANAVQEIERNRKPRSWSV